MCCTEIHGFQLHICNFDTYSATVTYSVVLHTLHHNIDMTLCIDTLIEQRRIQIKKHQRSFCVNVFCVKNGYTIGLNFSEVVLSGILHRVRKDSKFHFQTAIGRWLRSPHKLNITPAWPPQMPLKVVQIKQNRHNNNKNVRNMYYQHPASRTLCKYLFRNTSPLINTSWAYPLTTTCVRISDCRSIPREGHSYPLCGPLQRSESFREGTG